jgi:type I restriction enzyme S subunit
MSIAGGFTKGRASWANQPIEDCLDSLDDGKSIHQGWSPRCETFPASTAENWGVLKTTAVQDGFFLEDENKELPDHLSPKENLEISAGDVLMTCAGPRARCGVACWVPSVRPRLMISGKMYRFRADQSQIVTEYLALFLRSTEAWTAIDAMKTGSSESGLNLTKDRFRKLKVSFGTLDEQRQILAKVDELMALLDRLEATRIAREATRDRLTAASLARLTAPDADAADFPANARLALATLPALTTRPDQIKPLRQTILNLAVRGKLVEQDPTDETASELLDKLRSEASKKKKTARTSPAKHAAEMPFECPPGWAWAQVRQILAPDRDISYGVIKLGPEPKSGGVPTLRCSDVRPGFIELSGVRKVQESIEADYARTRLKGGEVVINIRGTLGGVALVPDDLKGHNVAREVAVIPIAADLSGPFLVYLMLSPYFWDHIQNNLRGIAYKGLNLGILRALPIPLPPLAEQHRIVAKVGALMALCDRLEAALTTADTTRARLLEALLHEALDPAASASSEKEAAE